MKKQITKIKNQTWIDYSDVQKKDYAELCKNEQFDPLTFADYSSHEQLPKYEKDEPYSVLILRSCDEKIKNSADKVQDLTTKIILYYSNDTLITVHRLEIDFITNLVKELSQPLKMGTGESSISTQPGSLHEVIDHIFAKSIQSFESPLNELTGKIESFEESVFKNKVKKNALREGYYLKRRASAFRKVLKMTSDLISKMNQKPDGLALSFLDRKDLVDRYYFYADDNLENMTVLLNLHMSISSQMTNEASFRTNEVMRVLTVFSIFFLPLNFIAGLYGMNFENMPELKEPNGYYIILIVMASVAAGLYLWMYRQGWLKKPEDL